MNLLRAVLWAANIALYAVLLDLAAETVIAGSPLRWIVIGAVVLYALFTVLTWKRVPVGSKVLASLILLGILLAYSGWSLGSLDAAGGVAAARQSTGFVAAAFIAVVLIVGVAALLRSTRAPLWAKVIIPILCLYAFAPIVAALRPNSGLSAALTGATLPPANPFWLRGSYMAVEIILPLLFLAGILAAVVAASRRQWASLATLLLTSFAALIAAQIGAYQAGTLGLPTIAAFEHPKTTALGVLAPGNCNTPLPGIENVAPGAGEAQNLGAGSGAAGGLGELGGSEQTPAPSTAPCVPTPNAGQNQVATAASAPAAGPVSGALGPAVTMSQDDAAQLLKAYLNFPNSVDRSSFDAHAQAAKFNGDTGAAFVFVRDQIANETYSGVLRGSSGTLSAQAGNDLDKSVLLGAFLTEQGHQVRYAQCALSDDSARQRIHGMFAGSVSPVAADRSQAYTAALVQAGVPSQRSADLVSERKTRRDALDRAAAQTAEADLASAKATLAQAGIRPTPVDGSAALLAEAKSHYWVQLENGNSWQDLDPSFLAAKPGQNFCAPAKTYPSLPDEVYQFVTVRVKNEFLEGGKPIDEIGLEKKLRTADLPGQSIIFLDLAIPTDESGGGGKAAIRAFVPLLAIGDSVFAATAFPFTTTPQKDAKKIFLAQWLEFDVSGPGIRSTVSRAIVDTVDPAHRAKGAIAPPSDLSLAAFVLEQPHAVAVSTGRLDQLQVLDAERSLAEPAMDAVTRVLTSSGNAGPTDDELKDLVVVQRIELLAYAFQFALASDRGLTAPWIANYPHVRAFRDQPLIVIASMNGRLSSDQKIKISFSVDVRNNMLAVVPETSASQEQAFWMNVQDGLIDGALERQLLPSLASRGAGGPSTPNELVTFTTSDVFALAQQQGIARTASSGQRARDLLQNQFANASGYRLASDIGSQSAIVLPSRPVSFQDEQRLGVWNIDLATGHTVALVDTGLRESENDPVVAFQGMTEYQIREQNVTTTYHALLECYGTAGSCQAAYEAYSNAQWALRQYLAANPGDEFVAFRGLIQGLADMAAW